MLCAGVMELADVSDSKSDGSDTVPVRPRSPAPAGTCPCTQNTLYFVYGVFFLLPLIEFVKPLVCCRRDGHFPPRHFCTPSFMPLGVFFYFSLNGDVKISGRPQVAPTYSSPIDRYVNRLVVLHYVLFYSFPTLI